MEKKLRNRFFIKFKTVLFISFFSFFGISINAQGLNFDSVSDRLQYIEPTIAMSSGNTRGIQSINIAYSLEKYLPPIGNQFSTPSCVGWATAYYGLTIVNRIEKGMQEEAFSPWSPYNRYQHRKNKNSFCEQGCFIEGVLNILKDEGAPYLKTYAHESCAIDSSYVKYDNKLFDWMRISVSQSQIKSALQNNNPVIIGLDVAEGIDGNYNLRNKFIDSNGVLQMNLFQNDSYKSGGHALCIVAFNDTLSGGAFKIANSWGQDWGKKGFCWLKYSDLNYIHGAYMLRSSRQMTSDENIHFITNGIEWINTTDSTIYLSYAYEKADGLINRGWFQILAKEKLVIPISERTENKIYWTVLSHQGQSLNRNESNKGRTLNCDTRAGFTIHKNESNSDDDSLYYDVFKPQNHFELETITLGFEGNSSIKNLTEGKSDNPIELNTNWDAKIPLIDPYSSQIIINSMDKSKKYTVHYMEDSIPKTLTGNIQKMERLKYLKFANLNNLKNYYQMK